MSKFSFGMGLLVESGGRIYSKLPNVKKNEHQFFTYERTLISGRFFTIPGKNALKTLALTHFSIVNFAVKSEFEVNWTLGMLKNA